MTSDYVRSKIEHHANAVSGRRTMIGKISIDWGWTSRVRLDDVAVSNADWGKADHLFKAERIEFDIRLWPLIHGNFVLPTLTLRKPEVLSSVMPRTSRTGARSKVRWRTERFGASSRSSATRHR